MKIHCKYCNKNYSISKKRMNGIIGFNNYIPHFYLSCRCIYCGYYNLLNITKLNQNYTEKDIVKIKKEFCKNNGD